MKRVLRFGRVHAKCDPLPPKPWNVLRFIGGGGEKGAMDVPRVQVCRNFKNDDNHDKMCVHMVDTPDMSHMTTSSWSRTGNLNARTQLAGRWSCTEEMRSCMNANKKQPHGHCFRQCAILLSAPLLHLVEQRLNIV